MSALKRTQECVSLSIYLIINIIIYNHFQMLTLDSITNAILLCYLDIYIIAWKDFLDN